MSIVLLIYSIRNKRKNICKVLCIINVFYAIYILCNCGFISGGWLDLDIGLEFVIFIPLVILAEIIFIVGIIFNCIKIKKLDVVVRAKSVISIMVFVLLLPVLAIILPICREMTLLNNSDFILVGTEGEMFGENTLVYTIGENYCKKVSVGANFRGAWIDKYFINPAHELDVYGSVSESEYHVEKSEDYGIVSLYKDDVCIDKFDIGNSISLRRAFLRN